jgi:hypothetical protein
MKKSEYKKLMKKIDTGLGDTISRAINKVTVGRLTECNGCVKRKAWLNKIISYKND